MNKQLAERRSNLIRMVFLWVLLVIAFFAAWEIADYFFFQVTPKHIMKRIFLVRGLVEVFGFGLLAIWFFVKEDRRYRIEKIRLERLTVMDRFSSLIAHEIRNPLTSISLNAELGMQELTQLEAQGVRTEELRNLLGAITKEAERLFVMTERYLNLSRNKSQTIDFFDPGEVIQGLVDSLKEEAHSKGIQLDLELANGTGPKLKGDRRRFSEAFRNLIYNSFEAMPQGGRIFFKMGLEKKSLVITVTDTGMGMTREVEDRLFEPFFTTKLKGRGLGLSLMYQDLENFDAEIQHKTAVGKGTSFQISFPLLKSRNHL